MSHADQVSKMPKNFKVVASTKNSKLTIIENSKDNILWRSVSSRSNAYTKRQNFIK